MSAGPLETYNGTSGVANNGGDSLTEDREFLLELLSFSLNTVLSELALDKTITTTMSTWIIREGRF